MDPVSSLRQTVTHLFDAVRYSTHASEVEEAAKKAESELDVELSKLESQTEELSNLLSTMGAGSEDPVRELSRQLQEFLATAKEQAKEKLERKAKEEMLEFRSTAESERDKALKSLEAFLATDPLPVIEHLVQVRLSDGVYEARSRYECEGGMKYDFRLAAQNSKIFHQEFALSQLGYEIRVPVRFSRALLKKSRVPGFERLDQYLLANAETSAGRVRANFQKPGNGANLKVITSGPSSDGFVGLEYNDQAEAVNVTNDPTLSAHVDLESIKKAMADLVAELNELSKKKVALLKLTFDGEESLDALDCSQVLKIVLTVLGPTYRSVIKGLGADAKEGQELSVGFILERVKVLGEAGNSVAVSLGLQSPPPSRR